MNRVMCYLERNNICLKKMTYSCKHIIKLLLVEFPYVIHLPQTVETIFQFSKTVLLGDTELENEKGFFQKKAPKDFKF